MSMPWRTWTYHLMLLSILAMIAANQFPSARAVLSDVSSVVLLSQAVNLGMGIVGAFVVAGIFKFIAWRNGSKHVDDFAFLQTDAKALALYKGIVFFSCVYFVVTLLK